MPDLNPESYQRMVDLLEAATLARENAYAPYSRYKVGAAVMGEDGRIWAGCNVENASYPVSSCAERNAVAKMVSDGCTELSDVAVVTENGGTPCGACLQVLLEFSPNPAETFVYVMPLAGGDIESYALIDLIPHGFGTRSSR